MKTQIKKIDACQRILKVEVSETTMQEEFEKVLNRFQKNAALPGFRLGKVPRELLLSRYGKDIEDELLKNIIPSNYVAALKETHLWPVGDPEISQVNWKPSAPLIFEAKVEVRPEIKLGHYKGLKAKKEIFEITESELDNEIKNVQEKMATFNSIDTRPLQKGDLAIVDLEMYVEGKLIPGGKNKDLNLEIGKDFFGPGSDKELFGLKINEKRILEINLPADYPSPEFQNKKAGFHITLKEIREKKLPAINDELARRIKDCRDLLDLKEKIKKRLKNWKDSESERKTKDEVIKQLLESTDFPLPYSLVERRKGILLEYTLHRLKELGFSEQKIKEEEKKLNEEAEKKAGDEVKLALILEAIAEKENIIVSPEEAREELKKINRYSNKKDTLEESDGGFIEHLRQNKTLKFILDSSKIQEVKL